MNKSIQPWTPASIFSMILPDKKATWQIIERRSRADKYKRVFAVRQRVWFFFWKDHGGHDTIELAKKELDRLKEEIMQLNNKAVVVVHQE